MRIGIITHPISSNYGGAIQNYALQQVLKKLNHNPISIDCHPRSSLSELMRYNLKNLLYLPFPAKRRPFRWNNHIHPLFKSFANHVCLSKYCTKIKRDIIDDYGLQALIVGSDQVWRPNYVRNLDDMFLMFAMDCNVKKISYAASFGVDKWLFDKTQSEKYGKFLSEFDAVSVREKSGIELCRNGFGVDASVVLDPTLLLDAKDYDVLLESTGKETGHYLLAYMLDYDIEKQRVIEDFAKQKGLEVLAISAHQKVSVTVGQWLGLFKKASCIVTDSFHGVAFSIIYRREFVCVVNKNRGAERFISLLSQLDLQDRMVNTIDEIIFQREIEWISVEKMLKERQKESIAYLNNSLSK